MDLKIHLTRIPNKIKFIIFLEISNTSVYIRRAHVMLSLAVGIESL